MKNITKLVNNITKLGMSIFLLLVQFSLLAAQTGTKQLPNDAAARQDIEVLKTLGLKKVHMQRAIASVGTKTSQQVVVSQDGLVTIMSEDFEGDFPSGLWAVSTGEYTWAKRNCAAHGGSFSAWAVGGGTSGSALDCGASYPNSTETWMFYGPFDLSDANWSAFSFFVSLNVEYNYDFFNFLVSDDGNNWHGYQLSGTTNGEWIPFSFVLNAVPTGDTSFENFTGKSSVWIAIRFISDVSVNYPDGAFVDDFVLQKGMVNEPTVLVSFNSPGTSPRGLSFDGANLWNADADNDRIYRLSSSGSVLSSFFSPGSIPTGLAWDGGNLWNADDNSDLIYKLSASGSVLSSFSAPGGGASGLVWGGTGFWYCDFGVPTIWYLDGSGGVLSTFSAPGTFHYGLAWDGQYLWLVDAETLLMYKMDITGNVLDYYLAPSTYPSGLAWDGANLWLADRNEDKIYKLQIEVQQFANDVGVTGTNLPDMVALGNSSQVGVVVMNYGTAAQSNFPVSDSINDGPAVTENFDGTLSAGASATKMFSDLWKPDAEGTYRFTAWTSLASDENTVNDTLPTPKDVVVIETVAQKGWFQPCPPPTNNQLNDIHFIDALTGWVVGYNGTILKTSDGGTSWIQQFSMSNRHFYDVYFINASTGWAVCRDDWPGYIALVYTTSDGGANWRPHQTGTSWNLYSLFFINSSIGWVVGGGGKILKTTSGGESWTAQLSGTSNHLKSVYFIDAQTGWVVGENGTILKTINGGISWETLTSSTSENLSSIYFVNAQTGCAVGENGTILKTADGGTSWVAQSSGTYDDLMSVDFVDAQTGWLVGANGSILHTFDGGTNWTMQSSGTSNNLYSVDFINTQIGLAAGESGTILKTTNGGMIINDVGVTAIDLPNEVELGDSITVSIVVKNFGAADQNNFPVNYSINNGPAVTENFTATLVAGASATKMFSDWWKPDAEGIYRFTAWTGLVGDENTDNDTLPVPKDVLVVEYTPEPAGWFQQTMFEPSSKDLYSVHFVDTQNGWTVGRDRKILKTSNGGRKWVSQFSEITLGFSEDVHFVNANTGVFVGFVGSPMYRTTDGGQNWTSILLGTAWPKSVHFVDDVRGWAVGITASYISVTEDVWGSIYITTYDRHSTIWKTTDGGASWNPTTLALTNWLDGVCFINQNVGWAVGDDGTILQTPDGGASWYAQTSGVAKDLESVHFVNAQTGWTVGENGTILSTTDGGNLWQPQASGTTMNLYSIYSVDALTAWTVGSNGTILQTTDGGDSWDMQASGTSKLLRGVFFVDEHTGWAVGGDGTILKTVTGGVTSVRESPDQQPTIPDKFYLFQNYPNPFNPSTTIEYGIQKPSHVELKVYDLLGREVQTLVKGWVQAGTYRVQFDCKELPSGLYFYRLRAGNMAEMKKMVVIK